MPFIDHHQFYLAQHLARIGPGQQQRQAFRRGDQHCGQPLVLCIALAGRRVATAGTGSPGSSLCKRLNHAIAVDHRLAQKFKRLVQGAQRVGSKGAHGRDPQHGERRRQPFFLIDICYFFNSCSRPSCLRRSPKSH